jgi:hypothetical protein
MGLDLSKVQSQVDLLMTSIQMLQKEHVVLLKSFSVMIGSSPAPPFPGSSLSAPQQTAGDTLTQHPVQLLHGSHASNSEPDHKCPWIPMMDFPRFDGTDVRIWLDKCSAYFHIYAIPPDFRVTSTSLHMADKATH